MRKKICTAMLMALTVTCLAGCSLADIREDNTNTDKPDTVDTLNPVVDGNTDIEDVPDTNIEPVTPGNIQTVSEVYDGAYAIFTEAYDTIYVIDSYDSLIATYDRKEFEKSKTIQDASLEEAHFVGYSEGVFYFLHDNWTDSDYFSTLYAIDAESKETAVVCHYSKDETIYSVDFYDGKIYVTFYNIGNHENKYYEDVYVKGQDAFEYELEGESQSDFLNKLKVTEVITNSTNSAYHLYCSDSVQRTIDKYSCVIANASGKYEKINAGGSVQVFDIPYTGVTVWGYDSRYVAITAYNEEYFGQYIYCYDMQADAYYTVGNANATILGYVDGFLYYAENESEEFGVTNNHIFKFDPTNGMIQELYDLYSIPGVQEINPGVTGFCYIKDHELFLNCAAGDIGWMAVYYDEAGATYKNLGCSVAQVNSIKYGTFTYTSMAKDCPFCNVRLMDYYTEIYQINESVSGAYEEINDYLRQLELGNYDRYIGDYYDIEDSSLCDSHNTFFASSNADIRVSQVEIISNKYIAVKYEMNSYGGGAHGSHESVQYMFDLESGSPVTIEDIYTGTEEEFREFAACKTRDDYLTNPDRYYSNSLGAKGVYDTAYEASSYKNVKMEFHEDKAYLVYREYEMGPYAAGEIYIEISYYELLGRNSL